MGEYLYLVGITCLIVAVVIGRKPGRNSRHSLQARDISGSAIVNGDVNGTVTQTVSQPSAASPAKPPPDRVAWGIGILGVLVSAARFVHDLLK